MPAPASSAAGRRGAAESGELGGEPAAPPVAAMLGSGRRRGRQRRRARLGSAGSGVGYGRPGARPDGLDEADPLEPALAAVPAAVLPPASGVPADLVEDAPVDEGPARAASPAAPAQLVHLCAGRGRPARALDLSTLDVKARPWRRCCRPWRRGRAFLRDSCSRPRCPPIRTRPRRCASQRKRRCR